MTCASPFSETLTTVPGGTVMTVSLPLAPCLLLPTPGAPGEARKWTCRRKELKELRPARASIHTLPPSPPLPPEGPPANGIENINCHGEPDVQFKSGKHATGIGTYWDLTLSQILASSAVVKLLPTATFKTMGFDAGGFHQKVLLPMRCRVNQVLNIAACGLEVVLAFECLFFIAMSRAICNIRTTASGSLCRIRAGLFETLQMYGNLRRQDLPCLQHGSL